jgi:hypothetical protein
MDVIKETPNPSPGRKPGSSKVPALPEEELGTLERDARALHNPKYREAALKALAELKKAQADFELQLKTAARGVRLSPDFKDLGLIKLVKLVLGAVTFLVLCASLIFVVLPVGQLLEGDTSSGTFMLLLAALSAVATSAAILYLLGRKSKKERDELDRDPIAGKFARQKLLFQISTLGLLAFTVTAIVLTRMVIREYPPVIYGAVFFFAFGYWLLGRKFWRCPACGYQLSFSRKLVDRQSIQSCPSCHATLQ